MDIVVLVTKSPDEVSSSAAVVKHVVESVTSRTVTLISVKG